MFTPETQTLFTKLTAIPERQLAGETEAADLIADFFRSQEIDVLSEAYETHIPRYVDWSLKVDGVDVPCLPCGLQSGAIDSKATILSSTISSQKNLYDANINFNPFAETISRSNFYFAPALAIARGDVAQVIAGTTIAGMLQVEKQAHTSRNFLVGNQKDPHTVVFTHYDSISTGAIDNASGTVLTLDLLQQDPSLLKTHLFVICGNEEISYDETIYWGHGYRAFEQKHSDLLQNATQILVLDSLGHTDPQIITDVPTMTLAFPVQDIEGLATKTRVIAGDLGALMEYYHAEDDVSGNLDSACYTAAYQQARQLLVG